MDTSLRIVSETEKEALIKGYAVVFDGRDRAGHTFVAQTDLAPGLVPEKPILIEHTLDGFEGQVGAVLREGRDDLGYWIEARLDKTLSVVKHYLDKIRAGKVGLSTGSIPHLVRRIKNVITRWPIVEVSLTTMPAEPRTLSLAQVKSFNPVLAARLEAEQENRAEHAAQPVTTNLSASHAAFPVPLANKEVTPMDENTVKSMAEMLDEARKEGEAKARAEQQAALKRLHEEQAAETERQQREAEIRAQARAEAEAEFKSVRRPGKAFKSGDPEQDEIDGYLHWMRTGDLSAVKTLLESDNTAPAMPTPLVNRIVQKASELSVMRLMGATVHKTEHASVDVAYVDTVLTAAAAESEGAELDAVQPVYNKRNIPLFKAGGYIPVSREALADQYFDLEGELVNQIARSIAARENAWFFAGAGTTEPYGVLTRATLGVQGVSGQFGYTELLNLMGSVPYEYTQGASLGFAMHRNTLYGNLAPLQVSGHLVVHPLPVPNSGGRVGGRPGTWALNGIPVYDVSTIPVQAPLAKCALFGDFSQYHIAEKASGPEILRNEWEDMAHGIVRFYFTTRLGGDLIQTDAVKYFRQGAAV